jgi:histidine ammonia-lyase
MQNYAEGAFDWRAIAAVAEGQGALALTAADHTRIETASQIVTAIVARGLRAYGVNTGVGALADTVLDRQAQSQLSRNIIMSHACGVGPRLPRAEVRAIMAAMVSSFARGASGVRPDIVAALQTLLAGDCLPEVPAKGSLGYLTHNAHIALLLLGEGHADMQGQHLPAAEALAALGLTPVVLQAKEGLSLVNGTAAASGLAALALARSARLLDWSDAVAAMTLEALGCQMRAFDAPVLALRQSPGIQTVGVSLRSWLQGSDRVAAAEGQRTQDALSLRAVPHVHGAARDLFENVALVVDQELASVTDNPAVLGTVAAPEVASEAHAVAPALGLALDALAVALAQLGSMSERRLDRLVNPLVSGLPAFLALDPGAGSGFMIAQYTAAALVAENRRLCAPASLDAGISSALQEDFICHPAAAVDKLLAVLQNTRQILAIELAAAAQAQDLYPGTAAPAPRTQALQLATRTRIALYADDLPLGAALEQLCRWLEDPVPG